VVLFVAIATSRSVYPYSHRCHYYDHYYYYYYYYYYYCYAHYYHCYYCYEYAVIIWVTTRHVTSEDRDDLSPYAAYPRTRHPFYPGE